MIKSLKDRIALNDGNLIPGIGAGTYLLEQGNETYDAVRAALEIGYVYIDTAADYGNEEDVGKAIRDSGIPREEIYMATKIMPPYFSDPESAFNDSFRKLGMDYFDLYLLHWPGLEEDMIFRAWEFLLKIREKGLVRSVGVSNFMPFQIEKLIEKFGVVPVNNQVELHPGHQQTDMRSFCANHGITVTAWSPMASGQMLKEPILNELGEKYGRSTSQIILRWHIQNDTIIIPKSARKDRLEENTKVFDFEILPEDMAKINAIDGKIWLGPDPLEFNGVDD